ncbi:hypothetical protein KM141_08670 [Staphylococcus coagulans]|nr:hypothetical protein [Staphylococcus coagulans]UNB47424.1 hypothetical protein KM141_08670 [Staphylococcus coagulans]
MEFENVKQAIKKLFKEQNGSQISKATGLPYQTVQDLRNEKTNLDDARLRTIESLYEYKKGLNAMDKIIKLDNENDVELVDSLGQFFTEIENDGNNNFNIDYVLLNEVEHDNGNTYYEVQINRTEEVPFNEEVTEDNIDDLESKWLEVDQSGENYVESVFFGNEEDAKEYIKLVLKGHKTFEEAAKAIGVIK